MERKKLQKIVTLLSGCSQLDFHVLFLQPSHILLYTCHSFLVQSRPLEEKCVERIKKKRVNFAFGMALILTHVVRDTRA